jgi:hypothetical protein
MFALRRVGGEVIERPEGLMERVAELKRKGIKPEQARRRREVDERNRRLQELGVRRGPNAPRDGTFGGKAVGS